MRALEGLKVLDLSRLLPGPFATLLLADLGASILKIEAVRGGDYIRHIPPLGGQMSAVFAVLNRNKRSLALNLKTPEGVAIIKRLAADADVLIESFRPGVMARLGLDFETLHALYPQLIYCSISGYGQTGPMAQRAGHDLNYLAIAGLAGLTGEADAVVQPGFQAADIAGGSLYPVVGILAALHQRHRTGLGQHIDASMTDGAAGLGVLVHAKQHLDGKPVEAGGTELGGARLCYRTWQCADGRWLAVGALEPKFWMALCTAVGQPDLFADGYAEGPQAAAAKAKLTTLFATRSQDAWIALLADEDVCVEPVLSPQEARSHPQLKARGLFGSHTHPAEGTRFLHQFPNPKLMAEGPPPVVPAPTLGEHTFEVLAEVGYSTSQIETWVQNGILKA